MRLLDVEDKWAMTSINGFGSEGGPEGLAAFMVTKAIHQV
jgi:hypothetical protein